MVLTCFNQLFAEYLVGSGLHKTPCNDHLAQKLTSDDVQFAVYA
jgi:hypothetical protein